MAFKGKDAARSKIIVSEKIIEQVNNFRYLGVDMSYNRELDIQNKLNKFLKITGLINRVLNVNKIRRQTKIKVYNTLAISMLTYGSEVWALRKTDKRRIEAAEMLFMGRTAGVTLRDRIHSEDIRNMLGVTSVVKRIKTYRKSWRMHVGRMEEYRLLKIVLQYTPTAKRPRGRPRRRLMETSGSSEGTATNTSMQTGQ